MHVDYNDYFCEGDDVAAYYLPRLNDITSAATNNEGTAIFSNLHSQGLYISS